MMIELQSVKWDIWQTGTESKCTWKRLFAERHTVGSTQSPLLGLNEILWIRVQRSQILFPKFNNVNNRARIQPMLCQQSARSWWSTWAAKRPSTHSPELQTKNDSTCWVAEDTCVSNIEMQRTKGKLCLQWFDYACMNMRMKMTRCSAQWQNNQVWYPQAKDE